MVFCVLHIDCTRSDYVSDQLAHAHPEAATLRFWQSETGVGLIPLVTSAIDTPDGLVSAKSPRGTCEAWVNLG